jgi:hypothetical protein
MDVQNLTPTSLSIVLASLIVLAGYAAFIVMPAWGAYGRIWEKVAASFLTLFILATLLGIGLAIGFFVVYSYDTYA